MEENVQGGPELHSKDTEHSHPRPTPGSQPSRHQVEEDARKDCDGPLCQQCPPHRPSASLSDFPK